MSPQTAQILFNLGLALALLGAGLVQGVKNREWIKGVEKKIPLPPSNETIEKAEQDLRDKINQQVGVQMDALKKQIELLEKSNATKQTQIEALMKSDSAKADEIETLSKQVARMEREYKSSEDARQLAEKQAQETKEVNIGLRTKIETYEVAMKVIEDLVARPTHITLALDGILTKQVVATEENKTTTESEKGLE